MTFKRSTIHSLVAAAAFAVSGAALAAGSHAGGHGHGHGAGDETAIGKPGVAAKATRTVTVEMSDTMRFTPSDIPVKQGEIVRLIVKNTGKVKHELSLGTEKELLEHLEQMKKFPDMEHDEPGKVTLEPGKQGEIVWQFTRAGSVNFACLIPGHYEAGMKGLVQVSKR
ncbi:MAG: cupredoxin domain-containing protein [Comamonas sp.]